MLGNNSGSLLVDNNSQVGEGISIHYYINAPLYRVAATQERASRALLFILGWPSSSLPENNTPFSVIVPRSDGGVVVSGRPNM